MTRLLREAWLVTAKDLKVELRSKEILLTTGYFGFLTVLIFAFAFFRGEAPISAVAAGILWVAVAFSGTLGLGRVFEREREGDCIRALLLSPISRPALYLGKTFGVLLFMLAVEAVVVPAVFFFFSPPLDLTRVLYLMVTVFLGTVGYSVVGTLLAAMFLKARAKDVLLAVVLYPLILPVLILGVKATGTLLEPTFEAAEMMIWLRLLGVYDMVFLVAGLWIFEPLLMD